MDFLKIITKYKNRPIPERKFDQFYATADTVIKRSNLLLRYQKKFKFSKIIFLGDDDLTSIALALTKKFDEIIVLDIDERILNFINEVTEKEKLNVKIFKHNICNPLSKDLLKTQTNFIFFDPPYNPSAVKIWLIRALEILLGLGSNKKRKNIEFLKNKFIFMCYGYTDKSFERGLKIQEIIHNLGLIIQEKFRKFNKYTGAETINNESDFYIIQPTPLVKLETIDKFKNKSFEEKIYTWQN
ncbi:MAG: hypothetical protein KatS3mg096_485 [Candidatus Parcubacteria bacterium]|nr:MAG: hypothetical protein KatS3mg096_485 [Candidatus Parcubacteria bacterium]